MVKFLYPLRRSSVIPFRFEGGVTSSQVWAFPRKIVFLAKFYWSSICCCPVLIRSPSSLSNSMERHVFSEYWPRVWPRQNPVVDISRMPDRRRCGPAVVRPGGPGGSRDLSPRPDLDCSVACPGRPSGPWWSSSGSSCPGGALRGLLTPYRTCQAGHLHVSPTACCCGTFFGPGDAVVGPSQLLRDQSFNLGFLLLLLVHAGCSLTAATYLLLPLGLGPDGARMFWTSTHPWFLLFCRPQPLEPVRAPSRALWPSPLDLLCSWCPDLLMPTPSSYLLDLRFRFLLVSCASSCSSTCTFPIDCHVPSKHYIDAAGPTRRSSHDARLAGRLLKVDAGQDAEYDGCCSTPADRGSLYSTAEYGVPLVTERHHGLSLSPDQSKRTVAPGPGAP